MHFCNRHSSFSVEGARGREQVKLNTPRSPSFSVSIRDGDSGVLNGLRNELSPPTSSQIVGVVIDADDNIIDRWKEIREEVERATAISLRDKPTRGGTIIDAESSSRVDVSRVGVWIMPDNENSGELEDFTQQMLPADDAVWPLSQEYINGIPDEHRKFAVHKATKAQFYAWLAARRQPGLMGASIGAEDLEIDGALCQRFGAWLEELFG